MTVDLTDEQVAELRKSVAMSVRVTEVWLGVRLTPEERASGYQPAPEMVVYAENRLALLRGLLATLGGQ